MSYSEWLRCDPFSKKPWAFTQSTTWLCLTQESTCTRWARAVIDQPVRRRTHTYAHTHTPPLYVRLRKTCKEQSVCKWKWERQRRICSSVPPLPESLLFAKGSSLTVCVVRGLAYTTHLFPVPAWQALATASQRVVGVGGRGRGAINWQRANTSWDNLGHGFRGLCISSLNGGSRTTSTSQCQRRGRDRSLQPCHFSFTRETDSDTKALENHAINKLSVIQVSWNKRLVYWRFTSLISRILFLRIYFLGTVQGILILNVFLSPTSVINSSLKIYFEIIAWLCPAVFLQVWVRQVKIIFTKDKDYWVQQKTPPIRDSTVNNKIWCFLNLALYSGNRVSPFWRLILKIHT